MDVKSIFSNFQFSNNPIYFIIQRKFINLSCTLKIQKYNFIFYEEFKNKQFRFEGKEEIKITEIYSFNEKHPTAAIKIQ